MSDRGNLFWPILGAVRMYLALVVAAGSHLSWFTERSLLTSVLGPLSSSAAVTGFLVISGFSIAASLEREASGYAVRRALRILPMYYASIAVALAIVAITGPISAEGVVFSAPSFMQLVQNLFFLQGFTAESIKANPVVWTLSIEACCYVLAPLFARLSANALVALVAASAGMFVMIARVPHVHFAEMVHGAAFALLAWAWLLGFLLHRIRDRGVAALVLLITCLVIMEGHPRYYRDEWHITICVVAAALGVGARVRGSERTARALALLGDASYPLYLLHIPVYVALFGAGLSGGTTFLLTAIVAAVGFDLLFDKPIKRVLRRRGARRAMPVAGLELR